MPLSEKIADLWAPLLAISLFNSHSFLKDRRFTAVKSNNRSTYSSDRRLLLQLIAEYFFLVADLYTAQN
jgi:hypothetical protein